LKDSCKKQKQYAYIFRDVQKLGIHLILGGSMSYTNVALKDKIAEMFPEVKRHGIAISLDWNEEKNAYVVKFKKGEHEQVTYIEKKDADECMDGIESVRLGIHIAEFAKNFEEPLKY
jgi:hypothetical protein